MKIKEIRVGGLPRLLRWLAASSFFVLIYYVSAKGLGVLLSSAGHRSPTGNTVTLAMVLPRYLGLTTAIVIATVIAGRCDGRQFGAYGLVDSRFLRRFAWGFLIGLGSISGFILFLRFQHLLVVTGPAEVNYRSVLVGSGWAVFFALVAVVEEMLFRGYLLFAATRRIGWLPSALLLTTGFVAYHWWNEGENALGLANIAIVGLVDTLSIYYTRSLWWVFGYHAAWDWGESDLWGAADSGRTIEGHLFYVSPTGPAFLSGGTVGPEGSIYNVVVLSITALGMVLIWRQHSRHLRFDEMKDSSVR